MIRRCQNPECSNGPDGGPADISHLKSTAKFCGPTCRADACRVRNPEKYAPDTSQALVGVQGLSPRQALVLATLREAGENGATTSDLLRAGCGSRFGGRIHELRERGYEIESERERQGSHRYTLTREPAGLGGDVSDPAPAEPNGQPAGKATGPPTDIEPAASTGPSSGGDSGAPSGRLFETPKAKAANAALTDHQEDAA